MRKTHCGRTGNYWELSSARIQLGGAAPSLFGRQPGQLSQILSGVSSASFPIMAVGQDNYCPIRYIKLYRVKRSGILHFSGSENLLSRPTSDIDVLKGTVSAGAKRYYELRGTSSMREKLHKTALASIKEEMALPRVSASATKAIARQEKLPTADYPGSGGRTPGKIIAAFAGVYGRIASKLKVSPSFVSKVASGSRKSSQIEEALCDELRILKKDLATY
jgi:hypothetical protein